ncbi:hypothetical protein KUCAC02_028213, partial [Chaenocephalus aceratus]
GAGVSNNKTPSRDINSGQASSSISALPHFRHKVAPVSREQQKKRVSSSVV